MVRQCLCLWVTDVFLDSNRTTMFVLVNWFLYIVLCFVNIILEYLQYHNFDVSGIKGSECQVSKCFVLYLSDSQFLFFSLSLLLSSPYSSPILVSFLFTPALFSFLLTSSPSLSFSLSSHLFSIIFSLFVVTTTLLISLLLFLSTPPLPLLFPLLFPHFSSRYISHSLSLLSSFRPFLAPLWLLLSFLLFNGIYETILPFHHFSSFSTPFLFSSFSTASLLLPVTLGSFCNYFSPFYSSLAFYLFALLS